MPALAPPDFPRLDQVQVDLRVLIVAALAAVFVGAISGLLPSLRSSRVDLAAPMHASGARTVATSGARIRRALLVVEAALAVVMLVGATLLARSFVTLVHVDAGYDAANVLTAALNLVVDSPTQPARMSHAATDLIDRVRTIPGVRAAAAGSMAPFGDSAFSSGFALPGMTGADGKPLIARALHAVITPGYAETLGLRLKEGRFFRREDTTSKTLAVIVNDAFATTYFNDGKPVAGRRFTGMFPRMLKRTDAIIEVVGVVGNVLFSDLDEKPQPTIYVPYGTGFELSAATIVVKTDGDPAALASTLRDLARQAGSEIAIDQIGPLSGKIAASVAEPRFTAFVLAAFSTLALALAITGLYGVLSYHVAQRRREIGVRAALGATRGDLVRMVLREGLSVTLMGLAAGLIAAAFATRAMASLLFGVTPLDAVAFASGPLLLLVVAGAACLIPARRAASIDPADALRAD